ncbi:MAG: hypothetical protein K0R73_70 [Candidatus Midichloriaceae bacterium]|jgi:hypothetical protein|nr:hypothetical protein [Candidatus Midichloriaceae bacterium]
MKHISQDLSSFITLKQVAQETENAPKRYANTTYISEEEGIKIYMRAADKIKSNIQSIIELERKIAYIKRMQGSSNESTELRQSITELYIKTKAIIEEFIRGFSVSHDAESQAIMSLLHRLFFNMLEFLNLAYTTSKIEYFDRAIARLEQAESLFSQMLLLEKKE